MCSVAKRNLKLPSWNATGGRLCGARALQRELTLAAFSLMDHDGGRWRGLTGHSVCGLNTLAPSRREIKDCIGMPLWE
jgi:hypothetical protein